MMFSKYIDLRRWIWFRLELGGWLLMATWFVCMFGCDMGTYNKRFEEHRVRTESSTDLDARLSSE